MKKILVLLVVFLSFSLTNCDRSEKSELSNVTASTKPTGSPSLKGGEIKSDYRVVLEKEFAKLWKKLEKKARDKRKGSGDISLTAAAPGSGDPIPPEEIWAELDDPTVLEFVENMTPASVYLLNTYGINRSSAPSNGSIVFAALMAEHFQVAVDNGVGFEVTNSSTISYSYPSSVSANDPFLKVLENCIKSALVSLGVDLAKVTSAAIIIGGASRSAIKAAILATLGTTAAAAASEIVVAWYVAGVLGCLFDHYITS